MTFNRQLRKLRAQKHMTQEAVADAIGAERKDISHWELGKAYPPEEMIEKFCELFSVPREFLVGEKLEAADPRERSIFDAVRQLNNQNKQRAERFVTDLLIVQGGEQKLTSQEFPVRAEANKLTGDQRCSFCGKPSSICDHLIVGNNSYICDDCVKLCAELLHDLSSKMVESESEPVTP